MSHFKGRQARTSISAGGLSARYLEGWALFEEMSAWMGSVGKTASKTSGTI